MICENCKEEFFEDYRKSKRKDKRFQRFCSRSCANKRNYSNDIKKKISKSLKGKSVGKKYNELSIESRRKIDEALIKARATMMRNHKQNVEKLYLENWDKLVKKHTKAVWRKFIIMEQNEKCKCCNTSKWLNKKLTLQIHHIDGDNKNNKRNNLEALCPNCHSLTKNYGSKNIASVKNRT
jgi:Zn finger protein HypA/HybF involved in hydrogenase expression